MNPFICDIVYGFLLNSENNILIDCVIKNKFNTRIEKYNNINELFFNCCKSGRLEVAQWLYGLINCIDIHVFNDEAFRWSCIAGYYIIAQWLYSLGGVDIHASNDWAFQWSCHNGHLGVAQWLYSLGDVNIHVSNDN